MLQALKLSLLSALLLAACTQSPAPTTADAPRVHPGMGLRAASVDRSRLISWDGARTFDFNGAVDASTITVNENEVLQEIDGFGAALTDSSAWLIQNKLSAAQRNAVMQALFGFNDGNASISYLRLPLGGPDFALSHYTFDDSCCDLNGFSIDHDRAYIIPLARQAKSIDGSLNFMATPWSAPAWMKTSGQLGTGKLNPASYPAYATYLRRAYDDYRAAGVTFDAMTIQNEPQFEPGSYPGMKYEWYDELNFVRDHLAPRMSGTGVKLLTFDHNWGMAWYPRAVLNEGGALYAGSAWHCYGGNVSAMTDVHNAYPNEGIYLTECSGTHGNGTFAGNLTWNMQHLFIGGVRNWAKTVLLWNLALDPSGNPHTGGCSTCRGVITINPSSGQVTYNEAFYAIARFVWPGARRIGSSNSRDGRFISAAFRNTNGRKAVVVLNQSAGTGTFRVVAGGPWR
ncbi:glycoside hydrolase family 30 protein [Deinococcus maricopensis]|uniref:Glucan endo-1,6-beta-glucosidase n=1 Tax=Deinococcus maricopensis (strain DSM 21211 / LMG 22137 / NRRL B-23946 / LB-34) TaxID=709986 RepID=E8U467_DEIML|nr:glycoside hydrolase family 30 beta sandwich domain-containing protein [Deinococcus maricopensis]ADV65904.1 Glucan endo-1,6-beta-glucosidase [Deinococcus maricopensis DSM 21211]